MKDVLLMSVQIRRMRDDGVSALELSEKLYHRRFDLSAEERRIFRRIKVPQQLPLLQKYGLI